MGGQVELKGADLEKEGLAAADVVDGGPAVEGHAGDEAVLILRRGADIFAIGAHCTHYGGPLAEGIVTGNVVRCPWHHACFDLRTGEATQAPALNPIACWKVEPRGGRIFVAGKTTPPTRRSPSSGAPKRVVVLGAGAAGACAVETLRREGYKGTIALVGRDDSVPVDRPNLSKDYLAGTAPEEWIPLRSREFYAEHSIDLYLGTAATSIDKAAKTVTLADGGSLPYDALLLAMGADPVRLAIPGAELDHVFTLRSLADSRAIIERAAKAKRVVVLGASFIGLEVAASLRARGLEVDVVAPDAQPLAKVLGEEVGAFIRSLHEAKGVRFHLGRKAAAIGRADVTLDSGAKLSADLVVMGVGVHPAVSIAEKAGFAVDQGVLTDEWLETDTHGVYAAGDVARYVASDGKRRRVEHWVHAERQGQVAARNVLGLRVDAGSIGRRQFTQVPFFWSVHYDVTINYVGYAEKWDTVQIDGSLENRNATIAYREAGVIKAIATVGRDRASLEAEYAMEQGDTRALEALVTK